MGDVIADALTTNTSIRYDLVFAAVGFYLLILWLIISAWVYMDAYKRFDNRLVAAAWGLGVFVLNFPMLIIYIMIRPEEYLVYGMDATHATHTGSSIGAPVVHLQNDSGYTITLSLSIDSNGKPQVALGNSQQIQAPEVIVPDSVTNISVPNIEVLPTETNVADPIPATSFMDTPTVTAEMDNTIAVSSTSTFDEFSSRKKKKRRRR